MIRDNADCAIEMAALENVDKIDIGPLVSEPQPQEPPPLPSLGSDMMTDDAHMATEAAASEDISDVSQPGGEEEQQILTSQARSPTQL
jgi:hypothetical protein